MRDYFYWTWYVQYSTVFLHTYTAVVTHPGPTYLVSRTAPPHLQYAAASTIPVRRCEHYHTFVSTTPIHSSP